MHYEVRVRIYHIGKDRGGTKNGQWPKTGAPGRFLARNGWAEVRRQQTLNLGSRDRPTPRSTRFWPYTDRDLPILATLVSSHPDLATFCCILLLFISLFDLTNLAWNNYTFYPRETKSKRDGNQGLQQHSSN